MSLVIIITTGCAARAKQAAPVATTPPPAAPARTTPETPAPSANVAAPALDPVFFSYDSHTLDAASKATLDRAAKALRENPDMVITIEGHCDERGTVEYNLALGEKRARIVREYLATAGIADVRLKTMSYGKERPFAQGSGERAWAQNRRAQMVGR
jgi:peptidoglycan-associated lipoprotein